ncbi:MAG: lectin like domain-containing protein, partial [Clostridiales bacterium]|jgi:hypothetical protein|nr:lectin like domain-containing protein [Clostridiales bacterium]
MAQLSKGGNPTVRGYMAVPYSIGNVKDAITGYGSVITSIRFDDSNKYYNGSKYAYYANDQAVPNRMVQIVGWDDDFPAASFKKAPSANGAWVAKGFSSSFGDKGYIYISYSDAIASQYAFAVTEAVEPSERTSIYSHGSSGPNTILTFNTSDIWARDTFTAKSSREKLTAVSFYTSEPDMDYEIWLSDTGNTNVKKRLSKGTADNAGFITVDMEKSLSLRNTEFSISVKLSSSSVASVPVEAALPGMPEELKPAKGQSFVSVNGKTWIDLSTKDSTACIKAWME